MIGKIIKKKHILNHFYYLKILEDVIQVVACIAQINMPRRTCQLESLSGNSFFFATYHFAHLHAKPINKWLMYKQPH